MIQMFSGECFQQLCDVQIGSHQNLQRNPIIREEPLKHFNVNSWSEPWDNPKLLFCQSDQLVQFQEKLHLLQNNFVLVSHNEDTNVNEVFQNLADSPKLIHWFAQNVMMRHPKLSLLPIGFANRMWAHGNPDIYNSVIEESIPKTKNTYFQFTVRTNFAARNDCREKLQQKGLQFGCLEPQKNQLQNLKSHFFAINPEGNGVDCHRIWESLAMDTIPIVKRNVFTELLNQYVPLVLINDWSEVNIQNMVYDIQKLQASKEFCTYNYHRNKILSKLLSFN